MDKATVAIVTRTQNRAVLFPRVYESVKSQVYKDFVWVIVNDGGERDYVDKTAAKAAAAGLGVVVVHNDASAGMEAASNKGIRSVDSTFIVIHDDDDSWEPEFLQATVGYLNSQDGQLFGGVITKTTRVNEILENDICRIIDKKPFNDRIGTVHLFDTARGMPLPPISFLYRRSIYDMVGGYDESLPVAGDWDFNLRFLMQADVACVPRYLANYHVRKESEADAYKNSVVRWKSKLGMYHAIISNKYLREDIRNGKPGLGLLLANARGAKTVIDEVRSNARQNRNCLTPISWRVGRKIWNKIVGMKRRLLG